MKGLLLASLLATFCFSLHSLAFDRTYIDRVGTVDLKQDINQMDFSLSYPGMISGLCGVEIRSRYGNMLSFYQNIEVLSDDRAMPDVSLGDRNRTIVIDFTRQAGSYVVNFQLKTKSGKTFTEVINEHLNEPEQVIMVGFVCQDSVPF